MSCCPVLHTAQVRHMTNGPESFTPDIKPVIGRTSEVGEGRCKEQHSLARNPALLSGTFSTEVCGVSTQQQRV